MDRFNEENSKERFTVENLMHGHYNEPENKYELEFETGWIINIPAEEHLEARTNESYWESQKIIDLAIEQGVKFDKLG